MVIRFAAATWNKTDGETRRWFTANGKDYAIAKKSGDLVLLDGKGKPVPLKKANKLLQALAG